jgi:hypothetical protein
VLGIVDEAFGAWRGVPADPSGATPCVRVVVREGSEHVDGHVPVRHVCPDATRLLVHSPGSVAVADPERGRADAWVTTALVADRDQFRVAVLEAITLALLSHGDRHPLHAAAIARDGHAVLLAGPSGAGKSTLACLAHDAGLDVLADDHVWVQRAPSLRVWGAPVRARLLPDAAERFPRLARAATPSTVDGKTKLVVTLRAAPSVVDSAVVCVLGRGGRARLEPIDASDVVGELTCNVAPGFDRFPERHDAVARALAGRGGWRLTLSRDPRDAMPLLRHMLDAGRRARPGMNVPRSATSNDGARALTPEADRHAR